MPEFILNTGDGVTWKALDEFTRGYIEAAFFTEEKHGEEDGTIPPELGVDDIDPVSLAKIMADCAEFQADEKVAYVLEQACAYDYEMDQAGRDFWYTRNRHGTGYWDRDLCVHESWADAIVDAAHAAGECDVYMGDDGKVCFE